MADKLASDRSPRRTPQSPTYAKAGTKSESICLVGGKQIVRSAIGQLLQSRDVRVHCSFASEEALADQLARDSRAPFDVVVLLLSAAGPFGTFRRIQDALAKADAPVPLVVVSEQATRGQIYAALRIGAKAYVNLDAEPGELVKAIRMAARNRVYLSPDAAELLVKDVSTAIEPAGRTRLPNMDLSRREVEVVQLLCEGLSSKKIGRHLHIAAKTVENHRYNIYRKCEVESIAGLMRHAIQQGLVSL